MKPATPSDAHTKDKLQDSFELTYVPGPLSRGYPTSISDEGSTFIEMSSTEACNAQSSSESTSIQIPAVNTCEAESLLAVSTPMCRAHPMDAAVVNMEAFSLSLHEPAKIEEQGSNEQEFVAQTACRDGDVSVGLVLIRGSCLSTMTYCADLKNGLSSQVSQLVAHEEATHVKGVPCKLERNESNGHRVCRVCYLGLSARSENGPPIELGCECKQDLAFAHHQCAETWFRIKGNRTCEICGSTVQNVCGAGDPNFLEHWNDGDAQAAPATEGERCWQNHRLFNVLLACMVFAFVLPWLFHVTAFFK